MRTVILAQVIAFNDLAVCASMPSPPLELTAWLCSISTCTKDGTASIFADEPRVLTVSVHCATNFPFRKAVSDHDLVLEPGSGDDAYLEAARQGLDLCLGFEPDLLLFQAGVDGLDADALGKLSVSRGHAAAQRVGV